MGLAVLPSRLKGEISLLCKAILSGDDLRTIPEIQKHADWIDELKGRYTFTCDNVLEILKTEIGKVFATVLEHAGVYNRTEEGQKAFLRFIASVN